MKEEPGLREWANPEYAELLAHWQGEVERTIARRPPVACRQCGGLRVFVMITSEKKPFSVPCSACNPGGI
ncbi:hypothetical protein [Streptomyces yaizuensis]|uniref:Uncharacterized protein n=1 Tax=Streptomyces yaizuensis TaxID=2989713 RepID=A0ABQ5P276_9ACTN|nr:hypothetical protein [Streptomyces sp. YSPA8]GLF96639.1 hypothetical protein SYYSPA8_20100 [Streptomyces sp. YSPA8]